MLQSAAGHVSGGHRQLRESQRQFRASHRLLLGSHLRYVTASVVAVLAAALAGAAAPELAVPAAWSAEKDAAPPSSSVAATEAHSSSVAATAAYPSSVAPQGADSSHDAASEAGSFRFAKTEAKVSVLLNDRTLLEYRHGNVSYKPYVESFLSPEGVNVLRDSPHDHVHHHALMFAIGADGTDFWGEFPDQKPGHQVHRSLKCETAARGAGVPVAAISGQLDWLTDDRKPVLVESRTVEVYGAGDLKASLLTWRSRLEPASGRESVAVSGAHYFGLGVRFVEAMDKAGRFANSSGAPGDVVRGEERLVRAKWCAYTAPAPEKADGKAAIDAGAKTPGGGTGSKTSNPRGQVEGKGQTVTVAVFDHPRNPRHPATMFTMTGPFSYLSATLNLWKQPLTLSVGQPLELCYGVAVWDGEIPASGIEELYQRWVRLASEGMGGREGTQTGDPIQTGDHGKTK